MIETVHDILYVLILITYIHRKYSRRQYAIPLISLRAAVVIIETDLKTIKGYFDKSINKWSKMWMIYFIDQFWLLTFLIAQKSKNCVCNLLCRTN